MEIHPIDGDLSQGKHNSSICSLVNESAGGRETSPSTVNFYP